MAGLFVPASPPELCGYVPLLAPKVDRRWLFVRANAEIGLRYRKNIVVSADQWVNNRIRYQRDQVDEWSLPQTTLERGYGDCEDIALLKWAILMRSGLPESSLYFALVRDLLAHGDHAVLLAKDGESWRLLDCHNSLTLLVEEVREYQPIFAFSGEKAWIYGRKLVH
jgi:predicted transglutaminase-like cysteine proteinase